MINTEIVTVLANISFVVSIIFFFFAVIQLINENKPLSNYFLSVVFFAVGIQCLSFWLYFRVSPLFERYFYYSDTAVLFLIGPFLYLFFIYITSDTPITLTTWLHTVPFFVSLLIIEGINLLYPVLAEKRGLIVIKIITTLSYLSLFLYVAMIFRLLRLYYQKLKTSEIKTLIHIIICSLVFSVALLLSETLWPNLQYIGHLAFLLIPMSFIFFLIRYPAYFNKAQEESQEIRYRNSQLGSVNKEEVVAGLDALLKQEKIYIDRTVTLSNLSSRLNISSAQLSEFLNSQYGTNFNNFINSYRIEEVKRILNNSPDTNVLETAFNCGFNSKSAFNTNFRKFTGLTPSEYKKKVSS